MIQYIRYCAFFKHFLKLIFSNTSFTLNIFSKWIYHQGNKKYILHNLRIWIYSQSNFGIHSASASATRTFPIPYTPPIRREKDLQKRSHTKKNEQNLKNKLKEGRRY